jgi:hypothetical protein
MDKGERESCMKWWLWWNEKIVRGREVKTI